MDGLIFLKALDALLMLLLLSLALSFLLAAFCFHAARYYSGPSNLVFEKRKMHAFVSEIGFLNSLEFSILQNFQPCISVNYASYVWPCWISKGRCMHLYVRQSVFLVLNKSFCSLLLQRLVLGKKFQHYLSM